MIVQFRTCVQKPLEAPKNPEMPKSCQWSEHAGVGSLQSTSKRPSESTRRTAWGNHADSQGTWKSWVFWFFGSDSHSDSGISVQTELFFWKANLLFSAFWCSWFVSLSQERDESSEEITRMHALEEKYKAEIAQLAKDSQVVSSFIDILVAIGCYRLFYGTFWYIPNSEKQMCLAG